MNIISDKLKIRHFIILLTIIFISAGCANVVSPGGGPVDEDPPKVIESSPPNFSTNYDGSDIQIYFDEFIELHNLRQKMLVSPPLEDMPDVRIRRRSIIISIEEELMDNTTYNLFFGDAIRDITEGNALSNFQFVVSTGDYVDSLSVRGEVVNAFDLKPAEDVYVMMYDNIYDSVPYKELPVYISRTCENGQFEINNMRKGEYLMFALKDLSRSYIYDQPDEKIAFLDSLIVPEYVKTTPEPEKYKNDQENKERPSETEEQTDTITEHETIENDTEEGISVEEDTTMYTQKKAEAGFYRLYLFQEEDTVQRISSAKFTPPGKLTFEFRVPFDSVYVEEYKNPFDDEKQKYKEFSKDKQSMSLWLDTLNLERDSLHLKVWDKDHLIDTVKKSIKPKQDQRRKADEPELTIKPNLQTGRTISYFKNLVLTANNPIKEIDAERIEIYLNDSIPVESTWEHFGTAKRRVKFDQAFEQDTTYSFIIPDSTFTDIYGLTNNDTLNISFNTTKSENYGKIFLDITLPNDGEHYILQLWYDDEPLEEKFINKSDEYKFHNLPPARYSFKLIHDKNKNGKWDTGKYLKGIQPEPVFLLDEDIEVRQNWEHEIIWNVNQ